MSYPNGQKPTVKNGVRSLARQVTIFSIATVLAFFVLLKLGVISKLAYQVEKGRLQALRESIPTSSELDPWNDRTRRIARIVAPSVVQIVTQRRFSEIEFDPHDLLTGELESTPTQDEPDTQSDQDAQQPPRTLEPDLFVQDGYGSGFVVDAERGLIVTNNHVINGADDIRIYLSDGRRVAAQLRGADQKSDIAVLQIHASDLHALPLADSDAVEVGDDVLAVGNPFGLDGSFSRGIISAKSRSRIPIEGIEYRGFLQTDAVINPGNSGGPLINMQGEVIGINTAIATESGTYGGVGFAIPSARVKRLLPFLQEGEDVVRGFLGVSVVNVENVPGQTEELGWESYLGVLVRGVMPNSPAKRHGIQNNDIIVRIDGDAIRDSAALIDRIGETTPGTFLELEIWRKNLMQTVRVKIDRQPAGFTPRSGIRD